MRKERTLSDFHWIFIWMRSSRKDPTAGYLAGGSIHRDDAQMRKLYGRDVLMADVVAGRVPLPPEVRLSGMCSCVVVCQVAPPQPSSPSARERERMTGSCYLLRTSARHAPYRLMLFADDALVHGAAAARRVLGKAVGLMRRTEDQRAHDYIGPARLASGACFVCEHWCEAAYCNKLSCCTRLNMSARSVGYSAVASAYMHRNAVRSSWQLSNTRLRSREQNTLWTIYTVQTLSHGTDSHSSYSSDGSGLFKRCI